MTTGITSNLFELAKIVRPYPPGVSEPPTQIVGTSFFPGGHGIWESQTGRTNFPYGGVMVLGHDFHNETGYQQAIAKWRENLQSPTWRVLIKLLGETGVPLPMCFFTNFFMGLRRGKAVTGPFPGANDLEFVSRCRLFLLHQLALQKPRLVLVLGNHVPMLISPLASALEPWGRYTGFKARDGANVSLVTQVHFQVIQPFPCSIVSMLHPSMRHANIRSRTWTTPQGREFFGNSAEVAMIKYAWSISNT